MKNTHKKRQQQQQLACAIIFKHLMQHVLKAERLLLSCAMSVFGMFLVVVVVVVFIYIHSLSLGRFTFVNRFLLCYVLLLLLLWLLVLLLLLLLLFSSNFFSLFLLFSILCFSMPFYSIFNAYVKCARLLYALYVLIEWYIRLFLNASLCHANASLWI